MVRCHPDHGSAGGGAVRVQSESYAPYSVVRRVGIRAEIAIIDADAKPNASASSAFTMPLSSPAETIDDIKVETTAFATLERNAWVLDGSCALMDSTASGLGWWSSPVSGDDGTFDGECSIVYDFAVDTKTIGLVFTFMYGYQPAVGGMRIRAYDSGGAVVADVVNTDQTAVQTVVFSAIYRKLRIDFTKTALPGRRIRFLEMDFGLIQRFDEDQIADCEIRYKVDFAAASLPYGECSLTLDNSDRRWNLLNPSGIYQYMEEGQKITVWMPVNGEDVFMGAFSFRSVEARDGALTAKMTTADVIASLDDTAFNGGRCAAASLSDAVSEVLFGTGIECVFADGVGEETVMMSIPQNTTRREAVRLLAQAARACVYAERDGNLRFCRPSLDSGDDDINDITPNELYNYDGITISEPVGILRLVVKDEYSDTEITYTAGAAGREMTVNNPCVASENGDAAAAWLLSKYARRKQYNVKNRCDPALELFDTVRISDAYGQNDAALITGITVKYNGGLSAETEAVG